MTQERIRVIAHVYDLAPPINVKLGKIGFGIWHSGIELQGKDFNNEFWFHGHDEPGITGVVSITHEIGLSLLPCSYSIDLGLVSINFSTQTIQQIIDDLTFDFMGVTYHPMKRNCNSFCEALCDKLGKRLPGFVNRLATLGKGITTIIPEQWIWKALTKLSGQQQEEAEAEAAVKTKEQEEAELAAITAAAVPRSGLTSEMQRNFATNAFLQVMEEQKQQQQYDQQQQQQEVLMHRPQIQTSQPPTSNNNSVTPSQTPNSQQSQIIPHSNSAVPVPVLIQNKYN